MDEPMTEKQIDEDSEMSHEELIESLRDRIKGLETRLKNKEVQESARKIIDGWPEWKRDYIGENIGCKPLDKIYSEVTFIGILKRLEEVTIERESLRVKVCERDKEILDLENKNLDYLLQATKANEKIDKLNEICENCEYH